jgi:putative transposase
MRVLQELMDQEVTEIAGPKGRHNPQRTAIQHGVEDGYVFWGDRRVP